MRLWEPVRGERGTNSVDPARSLQSRLHNVLAAALMSALGLGALTWYYATALTRQSRARQDASMAAKAHAQGDLPLPGLGRIDPPSAESRPHLPPVPETADRFATVGSTLDEIPLAPTPPRAANQEPAMPAPRSVAQLAAQRQLSGMVFAAAGRGELGGDTRGGGGVLPDGKPAPAPSDSRDLAAWLRPNVTAAVPARVLPAQRLWLPKGAFIDCTLETAIDSTLPGMTTCVMATDTFGVDGRVVLMERGTKLIGETRGQVQQGAARLFVLWTEARTPTGVVVPLDSPGADELGRAGLPGEVNRHFWERFGAAMLVSVIDGAVQAAAQPSRGGAVIVNPAASQDVLTEILKNTINVAPTVVKRQGDRIQVLVARDVDFRSVYELRSVTAR